MPGAAAAPHAEAACHDRTAGPGERRARPGERTAVGPVRRDRRQAAAVRRAYSEVAAAWSPNSTPVNSRSPAIWLR